MKNKPDLFVLLGSGATMPDIPGVGQLTGLLRAFETRGTLGDKEPRRIFDQIARDCEAGVDEVSPRTDDVTANPDLDALRDQVLREMEGMKIEIPLYDGKTGQRLKGLNIDGETKKLEIDAAKLFELGWHEEVKDHGPRPDAQQRVANFEDLLGVAEFLSRYSTPPNFAGLFLQRSSRGASLPDLRSEYMSGCYAVLRAVSEACDKVEANQTPPPLVSGLERLAEHFRLHIFSLNYDDIPEHANIEFFTGYPDVSRGTGRIDGSYRFFPLHLYQDWDDFHRQPTHLHLQMHGSVLFGPDLRGLGVVPRFLDRASARETWEHKGDSYQIQGGGRQVRLPMVTGYGKAEATLWEPFGTYLSLLRRTAMCTPIWLIIGYGGSDVHVNACLKSALIQAVEVNHVNGLRHAVIVDFLNFNRERLLDFDLQDPIGHKLTKMLFEPWAKSDIFEADSYQFLKQGTYFRPKTINRISKRLSVSLDGTQWALGDGIDVLIERLLTASAN